MSIPHVSSHVLPSSLYMHTHIHLWQDNQRTIICHQWLYSTVQLSTQEIAWNETETEQGCTLIVCDIIQVHWWQLNTSIEIAVSLVIISWTCSLKIPSVRLTLPWNTFSIMPSTACYLSLESLASASHLNSFDLWSYWFDFLVVFVRCYIAYRFLWRLSFFPSCSKHYVIMLQYFLLLLDIMCFLFTVCVSPLQQVLWDFITRHVICGWLLW